MVISLLMKGEFGMRLDSSFGREYAYLKKYGYYFDTVTKTMVK